MGQHRTWQHQEVPLKSMMLIIICTSPQRLSGVRYQAKV
jgi:hypothetical protein